jgi:SsrA-binding protein
MSPKGRSRAGGRRQDPNNRSVSQNRRARHDYEILDTFECGIALQGSEVKSLREGKVVLRDGYARVEGGEVWLHGVHVPPYLRAQGFGAHDPDRSRKLLLHRRQIEELADRVAQQHLTLVPLSLYLKDGRAKVELAVAKGRKTYDKRSAIAERDSNRDAARELRRSERGG